MAFLTGTGRHRAQIAQFLWWQIGSWRPLKVGLVVGSRLDRLRHDATVRELWKLAKLFMVLWAALLRELADLCWKRRRMRCKRLHVYNTDPRRPQGDLLGRD